MIHNKDTVLEYIAVVTSDNTGVNPPTATIMRNTLGAISWVRTGAGNYQVTSSGLFTVDNTTLLISQGYDEDCIIRASIVDENTIAVNTTYTLTPSDNVLQQATIEIKVYNTEN